MTVKKAVVLLSGGIDSYTVAAIARKDGFILYALSFDYNQRHKYEIQAARRIAESLSVKQHIVSQLGFLRDIGGSALTSSIPVPENRSDMSDIPVTYVPARNILFLSYAVAWAEVLGACDIFIGVNAIDYSGYPDCRPEFIAAYQQAVNVGTKAGVNGQFLCIRTPLIGMTKREIILAGRAVGCDYSLSISCYQADSHGLACGACDSCLIRMKGFQDAGVPDPTQYRIR
ncbi:MAG: 7-cyano-7-deazaguanine synthase QueC [Candidatus Auribacterota bacterium]